MHIHLSKQTPETFDPKQAVDLWLNQGQGGASAASSSSTMQEAEAVDSGGDTVEDSGATLRTTVGATLRTTVKRLHFKTKLHMR